MNNWTQELLYLMVSKLVKRRNPKPAAKPEQTPAQMKSLLMLWTAALGAKKVTEK